MFVFVGCAQKVSPDSVAPVEKQSAVPAETSGTNVVTISNFAFAPVTITINKGDTVTWKHDDVATHTVVSSGLFESPDLERGKTFSFKFDAAGTYNYHCGIHPSMQGTVVVK